MPTYDPAQRKALLSISPDCGHAFARFVLYLIGCPANSFPCHRRSPCSITLIDTSAKRRATKEHHMSKRGVVYRAYHTPVELNFILIPRRGGAPCTRSLSHKKPQGSSFARCGPSDDVCFPSPLAPSVRPALADLLRPVFFSGAKVHFPREEVNHSEGPLRALPWKG